MPFRFRRRVTLIPGIRINLSKRGASLSVGGRGATMNLSRRGKRVTVGLPGSGISYSEFEPHGQPAETFSTEPPARETWAGRILIGFAIIAVLGYVASLLVR